MILRGADTFRILTLALLVLTASSALSAQAARADTTPPQPVTATPPVQVVPATSGSKNVQQRMRGCNATADAKKLPPASRETFIKSCMASHHSHTVSRPGSQPKSDP